MTFTDELNISNHRLTELTIELAVYVKAHKEMCEWLGPYEDGEQDLMADLYREKHHSKIKEILILLSGVIRKMNDNGHLEKAVSETEVRSLGLGKIRYDKKWNKIKCLGQVADVLLHCISCSVKTETHRYKGRTVLCCSDEWTFVGDRRGIVLKLNIFYFSDICFRIVEYRLNNGG